MPTGIPAQTDQEQHSASRQKPMLQVRDGEECPASRILAMSTICRKGAVRIERADKTVEARVLGGE